MQHCSGEAVPKLAAEGLGVGEGPVLELKIYGDYLVLRLLPTAIDVALRGEKCAFLED
ncbi:hypothetical protein [Pyrobaculum aerophilum]|uniref:hypothetical protein n=1 Tax=Pyrobaculum aerophilum TaxID=13773 RepID=UPI0023F1E061|nr:hypothetical protein [Pyrobaculum aerophilum]MCX8137666.1 hypothetical protein [Pyrobaculum aerophilum]